MPFFMLPKNPSIVFVCTSPVTYTLAPWLIRSWRSYSSPDLVVALPLVRDEPRFGEDELSDGKYRWSGGDLLEGDGLAEAFELGDEASDVAVGVALAEVVGAEIVVELAGGEHVPAGHDDRVMSRPEQRSKIVSTSPPLGLARQNVPSDGASENRRI